jgi:hypothetical protein
MLDGDLTNSENKNACARHAATLADKGHRMRDLDNKVIDVPQAKLAYEVLVFLLRKQLCEAISRHRSSRLPFNSDSSSFYLLTEPHLMDINVTKLSLDSISVAHQAYSLSVVTPKSLLGMKREANIAAESIPVL